MEGKKPYLSKTIWMNVVMALMALIYPPAAEWIGAHPEVSMSVFAGINLILRLATKDKIELF